MSGWVRGNSPQAVSTWLNNQGRAIIINVQSEISKRMRTLTAQLQKELNKDIAGGPVPFTSRALFFNFIIKSNGSRTNQIIVRGDQAAYLRTVLTDMNEVFDKMIPTQSAKLNKQGNITGLKAGIGSKKLVVVEEKGKKYLIDTTKKKKKRDQRVVAVREKKRRSMVFDFFQKAEDGAKLILSDVSGTYTFTRRIN
ncbi:hypothetical protein AC790_08990 [Pantoea sp. RIT-PI-b]|uniref:hypothetical protein n=1 Tax=Pantoea sp. RIT-PI-b TaxID=1681195 RepID=UPI000676A255|nr:hypothetical protein [Pantoea sp. RIT-PI-b]KNC14322.1 hypothetical protein AC790_08990 [Pantoea sp. RIT-PI-b]